MPPIQRQVRGAGLLRTRRLHLARGGPEVVRTAREYHQMYPFGVTRRVAPERRVT
jgi:hypothetical protein